MNQDIKTNREKIVDIARSFLGQDASPKNLAPQELSCAEGVSNIIHQVFPDFPSDVLSTAELEHFLVESNHFVQNISFPRPGTIINSPRTATTNGHCGIFITADAIASNDSRTGKFELSYSLDEWVKEMRQNRGLRIFMHDAI